MTQDTIWMDIPLFSRSELNHIARVLGAVLVLVGGVTLVLQAYLTELLPPSSGFVETTATIVTLERTGTFQDPAFLITLAFDIVNGSEQIEEFRSGQRIEFEQYFELSEGDTVVINYNPQDPYEWQFDENENRLTAYGLGSLMILFGAVSLVFPRLVRWASRQEDFEFKDELENRKSVGAKS